MGVGLDSVIVRRRPLTAMAGAMERVGTIRALRTSAELEQRVW